MDLTQEEILFLKEMKKRGVGQEEAFQKLERAKGALNATSPESQGSGVGAMAGSAINKGVIQPLKTGARLVAGASKLGARPFEAAFQKIGADDIAGEMRDTMNLDVKTPEEKVLRTGVDVASLVAGGIGGRAALSIPKILNMAKSAGFAGRAGKIAQAAPGIIGESLGATAGFTASRGEGLPSPAEAGLGLVADVALGPIAGKALDFGGAMWSKAMEKVRRGAQTEYGANVAQKIMDAGAESLLGQKFKEYFKAQENYNATRGPSALAVFGKKIVDTLPIVKKKAQEVGAKIGDVLKEAPTKYNPSNIIQSFEDALNIIGVKPRTVQIVDGKVTDITENADAYLQAIDSSVFRGNPLVNTAKVDEYAKSYNKYRSVIPNLDTLDLPSAINAAKKKVEAGKSTPTLEEFISKFGRFDEDVAEFGIESTDDAFRMIQERAGELKGGKKPKSLPGEPKIESALTPKSFEGTGIELTPEDQSALVRTYNALKQKAERGTAITREELDNFRRSIQNLIQYSKGTATQTLTEAEVPLQAMVSQIKDVVKKGLTEDQIKLYEEYSKAKTIESLLSKRAGEFGQGAFSLAKSAQGEGKMGMEVRKALQDIKDLIGVDLVEDLDPISLVVEMIGDPKSKSLLEIQSIPKVGVGEAIMGVAGAVRDYASVGEQLKRQLIDSEALADVPAGTLRKVIDQVLELLRAGERSAVNEFQGEND